MQIRFDEPHSVIVTGVFDAVGRPRSNLYLRRAAPKQFVDNDPAEKTVAAVHDTIPLESLLKTIRDSHS